MMRILPALLLTLSLTACWDYVKPRVVFDLTNKSHEAIKNIEVNYPGGTYGVTSLDVYAVNHHTADIDKKNCVINVKFEDSTGHAMGGKELNMGETCPSKIQLVVNAQMQVSTEAAP
jgi:hypothetical protein